MSVVEAQDLGTELEALEKRLTRTQRVLDTRLGAAKALAKQGNDARQEVAELEEREQALDEALGVLASYAEQRQESVQNKIETLVTHGLRTIFGDDLTFSIEVSQKGKRAVTEFVVRSRMGEELVETPVMDARGGGVAAVVGFLLRLLMLLLREDAERVMFLDETFAQVSAEYEPALAEFIRELVDRTDVQIVLVTHSTAYSDVADSEYRFRLQDGRTVVTTQAGDG